MGMTIDNSIRQLEDYHKWEKQLGLDGSGLDDATKKLIEVAKKYQKIEQIFKDIEECSLVEDFALDEIREIIEGGNEN